MGYRPSEKDELEKTDDHSDIKALGIPLLKDHAVSAHLPGWQPDPNE